MENNFNLKKILYNIKSNNNICLIFSHKNLDGDAIGSQVALCRFLLNQGINAKCVFIDPIPNNLIFLIKNIPYLDQKSFLNIKNAYYIYLDCASINRVGLDFLVNYKEKPYINIDHHISNTYFAKYNIINIKAYATCEILYNIMFNYDQKSIDPLMAQALYTGIATDTNQFTIIKKSSNILNICDNLIKLGANPDKISLNLYHNYNIKEIYLLKNFLNSLKIVYDKVCIGYIDTPVLIYNKLNLIQYTYCIKNILIGILLENKKNYIKGSLRSINPKMRVDLIANKFDEGGGHPMAAGFIHKGNMEEVEFLLMQYLKENFKFN